MSYKLQIKQNSVWYDVSDFIIDISEIPFILRNNDFSVIDDIIKVKQSRNYTRQFNKDDLVLISTGSVVIYNGIITDSGYNYDRKLYEYEIQNNLLSELKSINFSEEEMGSYIAAYSSSYNIYNQTNSYNKKFIKVNDLINAIFDRTTLNANWTYSNTGSFNNIFYYSSSVEEDAGSNFVTYYGQKIASSISENDIYFYVPQLYCINQELIWTNAQITADPELDAKRLTLYDVVSNLFSMLGKVVVPSGSNGCYIVNLESSPGQLNIYDESYQESTLERIEDGLNLNFKSFGEDTTAGLNEYYHYPFLRVHNTPPLQPYVNPYVGGLPSKIINETTSIGVEQKEVEWPSHLLPWYLHSGSWVYNLGGSQDTGVVADIILPVINQPETVLRNIFNQYLGSQYIEERESNVSVIPTTYLTENYITIEKNRQPYSKTKRVQLTFGGL